jgi:5'-deoxynucleotidase YfbR-like HD superfamily hydrolase
VERWNIAPRLHRQSVAEHSYYVGLYAGDIARHLELSPQQRLDIIEYAQRHDLAEIVTGDMPGPAKRALVDRVKLAVYEGEFLEEVKQDRFLANLDPLYRRIVKAADTIDAYFWCRMEVSRGNRMMLGEQDIACERMLAALRAAGVADLGRKIIEQGARMDQPIYLSPRLDTDLVQGQSFE